MNWQDEQKKVATGVTGGQEFDKPLKQKRPQNCGTSFCSCIECVMDKQDSVTLLPDGSAFGVMSFPLPDDHWLYAPNEYRDGEYEPIDLPKPILTHALRNEVVAAVRYAVRGVTMRGQGKDFDPDALVQNAVYALCGPYNTAQPKREWAGLTDEERKQLWDEWENGHVVEATEAKLKEKNT